MTAFLNQRCVKKIDISNQDYLKMKEELFNYKINKLKRYKYENEVRDKYEKNMFSPKRISNEQSFINKSIKVEEKLNTNTIYSYLDYHPHKGDVIIENDDIISNSTEDNNNGSISFINILELIFKFYAEHDVNVAIKFNEFFELQKAYVLILKVLDKVGYSSFRQTIVMRKAFIQWKNLSVAYHLGTVFDALSIL